MIMISYVIIQPQITQMYTDKLKYKELTHLKDGSFMISSKNNSFDLWLNNCSVIRLFF